MTRFPLQNSPRSFRVADTELTFPFEGYSVDIVLSGLPTEGDTVTVGSTVYTWRAAPAGIPFAVDIGVDAEASRDNLQAAIDLSGTDDVEYGAGTTAHPDASANTGFVTDSIHLVSLSDLVVSESTANLLLKNVSGTTVAAMTQYPTGDYTKTAAKSALVNSTGCAVTGITNAEGAAAGQGLEVRNHAGVQAQYIRVDEGPANDNICSPVTIWTDAGIGAVVDTDWTGYLHYVGYPTPARFSVPF